MAEKREKSFGAIVRPWLRAIHRDVGYVAVGLTFVYALSGIAVNHITDWNDGDPSFRNYSRTVQVGKIEGDDQAIERERPKATRR